MKTEIWKDIEGYKGLYMISNKGRVISLGRKSVFKSKNQYGEFEVERVVSPRILSASDRQGYKAVVLYSKDGEPKPFLVHRLVITAFIPNPQNKPCVNHKDGNPSNNRLSNLEWCTYGENISHAYENNLNSRVGEKHNLSTLKKEDVLDIRERLENGERNMVLADEYDVTRATISDIKSRRSWKHLDDDTGELVEV